MIHGRDYLILSIRAGKQTPISWFINQFQSNIDRSAWIMSLLANISFVQRYLAYYFPTIIPNFRCSRPTLLKDTRSSIWSFYLSTRSTRALRVPRAPSPRFIASRFQHSDRICKPKSFILIFGIRLRSRSRSPR